MTSREELLEHLWRHVINVNLDPDAMQAEISRSKSHPNALFADTGAALERLLVAGGKLSDICLARRQAAYAAVFATLYAIGDLGVDDDNVLMLFEKPLMADPSDIEGRPGLAAA